MITRTQAVLGPTAVALPLLLVWHLGQRLIDHVKAHAF